jgi:hypothetical protein
MKKKVFFAIYGIASFGLIVYGAISVLAPDILFEPFSMHVYQFPDNAGAAVSYLKALFRLLGYFNLIVGILCLYFLYSYRESQKLILVILALPLAYLGPIIFDNTVGNIGVFEIIEHILFVAMVLAGATMLVKKGSTPASHLNPS